VTLFLSFQADENLESKGEAYKQYVEAEKAAKSNPARRICKQKQKRLLIVQLIIKIK
jgi:hypothetical protein